MILQRKKYRSLLCVALCLFLTVPLFSACFSSEPELEHLKPAYVSPYDWSNLEFVEGRFHYYKEGKLNSRTGIDVSEHQESINWVAVAEDGIEFAYVRLGSRGYTEGQIYLDEHYYTNIAEARNAGLKVGVYFFSQAINEAEAREEAEFVLSHLEGIELDYPVVYDHEPLSEHNGRANHLSGSELTKNAQAFCTTIEDTGKSTMIYGNGGDIGRLDSEVVESHDIWFAEYNALTPSGQFDFILWQYTNKGEVDGIDTPVDMNIHFLTP